MKVISLLVTLALLVSLAAAKGPGVCDFGVETAATNMVCVCYSGYATSNCTEFLGQECVFPVPDPLATGPILTFMGASSMTNTSNNMFNMILETTQMNGRYISDIGVSGCQFPSTSTLFPYVKGFDTTSCMDMFSFSIQFQELVDFCDVAIDTTPTEMIVTTSISAVAVDTLAPLRGVSITRTTTASMGLEITLPTIVNVTVSNLTIVSPVELMGAVTSQSFDLPSETGMILVTTSVQYPFLLTNVWLSNYTIFASPFLVDNSGCPNVEGVDCLQVWLLNITLGGSGLCNFDGTFTLSYDVDCQGVFTSSNGCPSDIVSQNPSIEFSISSDNICNSVSIISNIAGSIESFSDSGFSNPTVTFPPDATIYFQIPITADVNLNSITILAVRVVQDGTPQQIFNGTEADSSLAFTVISEFGSQVQFSFVAVAGSSGFFIFDLLSPESLFTFTVEVDLVVSYQTTTRKRDSLNDKITFRKPMALDLTKAKNALMQEKDAILQPNAAASTSFTAGSVLASAAAVGLMAYF